MSAILRTVGALVARRARCEREDERGAVLILAAAALALVMASTALTVDIGRQVTKKRYDSLVADQAAADAVSGLGKGVDTMTTVKELAVSSAVRNNFRVTSGGSSDSTDVLTVVIGQDRGSFTPMYGWDSQTAKYWDFTVDPTTPRETTPSQMTNQGNADTVMTGARSHVDYDFIPGSQWVGTPTRILAGPCIGSCAQRTMKANLQAGSFLARGSIGTTEAGLMNALLSRMIGSSQTLTFDAVSYQGLAATSVTVDNLRQAGGYGTPDTLLNQSMTLKQFYSITASALASKGDPASVTASGILGTLSTSATNTLNMKLGDFLKVDLGGGNGSAAAAAAGMRVLDLVDVAAEVALANGTNLLQATLPVVVPGVSTTTIALSFVEKPFIYWGKAGPACCPYQSSSGQIRMQLNETLTPAVPGVVGNASLPIYVEGAGAGASITNMVCKDPDVDSPVTVHTDTHAAAIAIGAATSLQAMADPSATVTLNVTSNLLNANVTSGVGGALVTNVAVGQAANYTVAPASDDYTFTQLPSDPPPYRWLSSRVHTVGGTNVGAGTALVNQLNPTVAFTGSVNLTLDAAAIKASIKQSATVALGGLDALFNQIAGTIGVRIGGADIANRNLKCDAPELVP